MEFRNTTFHEAVFLPCNLDINDVARYGILCKNDHVVDLDNCFSFGSYICDS